MRHLSIVRATLLLPLASCSPRLALLPLPSPPSVPSLPSPPSCPPLPPPAPVPLATLPSHSRSSCGGSHSHCIHERILNTNIAILLFGVCSNRRNCWGRSGWRDPRRAARTRLEILGSRD